MRYNSTRHISYLVSSLWSKLAHLTGDQDLKQSFKDHVTKTPGALSSFHDASRGNKSIYTPNTDDELFHAFRDPIAQISTAFHGRMHEIEQFKPPSKMAEILAMTCYYLEQVQTKPYRHIFNITTDNQSNFSKFLNEIDVTAIKIRELVPSALEETGNTQIAFDNAYKNLSENTPIRVKSIINAANNVKQPELDLVM